MCCGRAIKNAASRHYVSPPSIGSSVSNKHKDDQAAQQPVYQPQGAYYGNPIPREDKAAEKASEDADKLAKDTEKPPTIDPKDAKESLDKITAIPTGEK